MIGVRDCRCERGTLECSEAAGVLPEISFRGGGDTVVAAAVVDPVYVELEDLLLAADCLLDASGEENLGDLPADGPVLELEREPRQLLGDGRCPLVHLLRLEARDHRAGDADIVDAVVLVESAVFRREQGIDEIVRNLLQFHRATVLDENAPQFLSMDVEDAAGDLHFLQLGQIEGVGEIVAWLTVEIRGSRPDDSDDQEEHQDHPEEFEPENRATTTFGLLL